MARLTIREIREFGREVVQKNSGGIRFADIVSEVIAHSPETNANTIRAQIGKLERVFPESIEKPSRGLYVPVGKNEEMQVESGVDAGNFYDTTEEHYYEPFADFLTGDLDECSTAVVIGSMRGNGKWGNPDVVGINKSLPHHVIKFESEIISAEIKTISTDTVTAFGQAVAYRLFSHKTYLALPNTVTEAEAAKMFLLCNLFGIGLVYFDLDPQNPNFSVHLYAQKFVPDMFSLNDFAEKIRISKPDKYNKLFG